MPDQSLIKKRTLGFLDGNITRFEIMFCSFVLNSEQTAMNLLYFNSPLNLS
jgi:hypothetical protein